MRCLALVIACCGLALAQPATTPKTPSVGGPPPILYNAILGMLIERHMKLPTLTPRRTAAVRITMDETGAIVAIALEKSSGEPPFDTQVLSSLSTFQLTGIERLPVPTDPPLRKAALGDGLVVKIRSAAAPTLKAKTTPAPAPKEASK